MLRNAAENEVRDVAAPLQMLLNGSDWPKKPGLFNPMRNGAASIVAHLAYSAIGSDERERKNRAKIVPCYLYQKLISANFDFIEALRRRDFRDVEVVRTKCFVAIVIPKNTYFLIGVRGTQFAYDWLINLNVVKAKATNGLQFHAGFLKEALELAQALTERFRNRYQNRSAGLDCAIYLAGHSLGGAVAALLSQMEFIIPSMKFEIPINECYMYGAPRISNANQFANNPTLATRRYLDIVPHCPPRVFDYVDFINQRNPNSDPFLPATGIELYFFASWLGQLAFNQFPKNHSMEHYRFEVLKEAKRDSYVQRCWDAEWPDFAPPA